MMRTYIHQIFSDRIVHTYHAALKGSALVSHGIFCLCSSKLTFLDKNISKPLCDGIAIALVIYALDFQAQNMLGGSSIINTVLNPLSILEQKLSAYSSAH